jgi:hypothetical protein
MPFWNRSKNPQSLRVIKTARDEESINQGVKKGFKPLIKKVEPSKEIQSKFSVAQNRKTGEITVIGDYRSGLRDDEYEMVIGWTYYYPYNFKSPFAAYLIPKDIAIGERVFIEDLIEDYVGASWNQGDRYRLESCEAIWNGLGLEIQYDPKINRSDFIG